jgi:dolichyl-phosphate-mannose-protein mannosyltransferase
LDLEVKQKLLRIINWEYFWLCLCLLITLAMHLSIVTQVNDMILDEAHYVKDARSIILTQMDQRPEHPPLSKLFIVAGIRTLGDNPWGWRVPGIIMGTLSIALLYIICRRLQMSRRGASIATALFAFENFAFMIASVAMLDVFFVTLTLAFFALYLYRQYALSGIFIGIAALAKLFAAIAAPALAIHWFFTKTRQTRWFALTVILAPISLLVFIAIFDFAINHQIENPITRVTNMLSLTGSLKFSNVTHPSLSRPWAWLLNYQPMAFWYTPNYYCALNPNVWLLMIPTALFMLYRALKRDDAGLFGFAWFFSTFVLWIPASIITNRVSFIFYFYPTIGALCLGLGLAADKIMEWLPSRSHKIKIPVWSGLAIFFLVHAGSFVLLSPFFFRT